MAAVRPWDDFAAVEADVRVMVADARWQGLSAAARAHALAARAVVTPDGGRWLFGAHGRWYLHDPADGRWHLAAPPRAHRVRPTRRGALLPDPHMLPDAPDFTTVPCSTQAFIGPDVPADLTERVRVLLRANGRKSEHDYPLTAFDEIFAADVPSTVAAVWGTVMWCAYAPAFDGNERLITIFGEYLRRPLPGDDWVRWLPAPPLTALVTLFAERVRAADLPAQPGETTGTGRTDRETTGAAGEATGGGSGIWEVTGALAPPSGDTTGAYTPGGGITGTGAGHPGAGRTGASGTGTSGTGTSGTGTSGTGIRPRRAALRLVALMADTAHILTADPRFAPRAHALLAMIEPLLAQPGLDDRAALAGDESVRRAWLARCPAHLARWVLAETDMGAAFRHTVYDLVESLSFTPDPPRAAASFLTDLPAAGRRLHGWLDHRIRYAYVELTAHVDEHGEQTEPDGLAVPAFLWTGATGGWPARATRPATARGVLVAPPDRGSAAAVLGAAYAAGLAWCRLVEAEIPQTGFAGARAIVRRLMHERDDIHP